MTYTYVEVLNDDMPYVKAEILGGDVKNVYYLIMWVLEGCITCILPLWNNPFFIPRRHEWRTEV
jgi:hypothetical protein